MLNSKNTSANSSAPLFKVPGRTHQVEVFYTQESEPYYSKAAIRTALMIHRAEDPGDILSYLTGEEEIEETCQKIKLDLLSASPCTLHFHLNKYNAYLILHLVLVCQMALGKLPSPPTLPRHF